MYNATAYKLDVDGKTVSTEAVEVDDEGRVVRACGFWSAWNGRPEFDAMWRGAQFSMVETIRVELDGGAGYRARLSRLALPPKYAGAWS